MILITGIFFLGLLVFGCLASLSDYRTGMVKNSLLKKGFLSALLLFIGLLLWTVLRSQLPFGSGYYLNYDFFLFTVINLMLATVVGFLFWKYDIWAAADAKLFILLVLFTPITLYNNGSIKYFQSFALLLNIYILYILWLLIIFMKNLKRENFAFGEKLKLVFKKENLRKIVDFLFAACLMYLVFSAVKLTPRMGGSIFTVLSFIIIFISNRFLSKFFSVRKKLKKYFMLVILAFLTYNLILAGLESIKLLYQFLLMMLFMKLAAYILIALAHDETKTIKVDDLKAKMILSTKNIDVLKKFVKREEVGKLYPDGISEEQSNFIKTKLKAQGVEEIGILATHPFAPFIFAGALATFVSQGSLIYWIMLLINKI